MAHNEPSKYITPPKCTSNKPTTTSVIYKESMSQSTDSTNKNKFIMNGSKPRDCFITKQDASIL